MPDHLLRAWGGDLAKVTAVRKPDAVEPGGAAAWWFDTLGERAGFRASIREKKLRGIVFDEVDNDHTRKLTWAQIVLEHKGKRYQYSDCFGFGYETHSVEYMYQQGNYACDCNLSAFIKRNCDPKFRIRGCGESITLVKLTIIHLDPGQSADA